MSTDRVINFLDQFAGDVIDHKDSILTASAVIGLADGRILSLTFGDLDITQAAVDMLWARVTRMRKAHQAFPTAGIISENLLQEVLENKAPERRICIDPDCELSFAHVGEHRDYTGRSWP